MMQLYDGNAEGLLPANRTICQNPLHWSKLCSINFVRLQDIVDTMLNCRKAIVNNFNHDVLKRMSNAMEQIKIPSGTLFTTNKRFPDSGIFIAWIPAHPLIHSYCDLQKYTLTQSQAVGLPALDELLTLLENVENHITVLDSRALGVYDREKFEKEIAIWKFHWTELTYYYEKVATK